MKPIFKSFFTFFFGNLMRRKEEKNRERGEGDKLGESCLKKFFSKQEFFRKALSFPP